MLIEIAGHPIEFIDESGAFDAFFEPYCAADNVEPEFTITVNEQCVNEISFAHGSNSRFFLIHKAISDFMIVKNVLNIHASALIFDGKAYLFSAPSGTGKSTHTRLWREAFGERVTMISDDQPFIRLDGDGVSVYGSPYNGKEGLGANINAPIGGICLLSRSETNTIRRLRALDALIQLSPNCYIPEDKALAGIALGALRELVLRAPVYSLACTMEKEAAVFSKNGIVMEC